MKDAEDIDPRHVEAAIAVALQLARFRPTRGEPDVEAICGRAAAAVMASFGRSGWAVIKTRPYAGNAGTATDFGAGPLRAALCPTEAVRGLRRVSRGRVRSKEKPPAGKHRGPIATSLERH
jgi:hypothetical protein